MRVELRFYEELNDFLSPVRRKRTFPAELPAGATAGDAIRAHGVPVELVDLVLVGGESAGLDHPLREGDRVSVYPVFETLDITPLVRIPGRPLGRP